MYICYRFNYKNRESKLLLVFKAVLEKERRYGLSASFCIVFEKNIPSALFLTDSNVLIEAFRLITEEENMSVQELPFQTVAAEISGFSSNITIFGSELIFREMQR